MKLVKVGECKYANLDNVSSIMGDRFCKGKPMATGLYMNNGSYYIVECPLEDFLQQMDVMILKEQDV